MGSKVAIVTGASSGIGLRVAETLLERGYRVVAASRSASKHPALAEANRFIAVDGDVGEAGTAARAVEAAWSRFGGLDLLVNNAGIFVAKRFTDYTADDYAKLAVGHAHVEASAEHMCIAGVGPNDEREARIPGNSEESATVQRDLARFAVSGNPKSTGGRKANDAAVGEPDRRALVVPGVVLVRNEPR